MMDSNASEWAVRAARALEKGVMLNQSLHEAERVSLAAAILQATVFDHLAHKIETLEHRMAEQQKGIDDLTKSFADVGAQA